MYRWTVRLQTRMPSLSSSPRRRSAPQRGLLVAISRISAARAVGGRPDGRERRRQNARQPAWCQRRMVAGWTSKVASRHAGARRAPSPIVKRCHGAHRTRPAIFRCATMSCCRSRAFSATRPGAAAHDVGSQPHHEPKDLDHAARRTAVSVRMAFVARTVAARLVRRLDYVRLCGLVAGSMTDPPALAFGNTLLGGDVASTTYAAVYPLTMILRVITAQMLALFTVGGGRTFLLPATRAAFYLPPHAVPHARWRPRRIPRARRLLPADDAPRARREGVRLPERLLAAQRALRRPRPPRGGEDAHRVERCVGRRDRHVRRPGRRRHRPAPGRRWTDASGPLVDAAEALRSCDVTVAGDGRTHPTRGGSRPEGPLEEMGTLPQRAPVGDGPRGLQ